MENRNELSRSGFAFFVGFVLFYWHYTAAAEEALNTRDEREGELRSLRKQIVLRAECEAEARQQVDEANARGILLTSVLPHL